MRSSTLVTVGNLSVRYGATVALNEVSLDLQAGEVHAVVGENGAGKSTLLRAIAGLTETGTGEIRFAAGCRPAYVPQETILPADLTAAEWIFLNRERHGPLRLLHHRAMLRRSRLVLDEVGAAFSPQARLGSLTAAQRKQVQLARAIDLDTSALLFDEPTAVLASAEATRLFDVIRRRRAAGMGILYVSHRIEEVLGLADRVTVLRDGRHVSTDPATSLAPEVVVQRMVGRVIPPHWRSAPSHGPTALRCSQVCADGIDDISFDVGRGEIVGLAGLLGSGRSAVLEAIAGLLPLRSGSTAGSDGAVLVPEDRTAKGLIAAFNLRENVHLPATKWIVDKQHEADATREWIRKLSLQSSGSEATIESLSGGNQQKVLLARALRRDPEVLLLDEPTVGVDVGAKAEIHDLIRELASRGTAILLASSDLPELLALSDRILALRSGRIVGSVEAPNATEEDLAALITGAAQPSA